VFGGAVRDATGGFGLAFQIYAGVIAVVLAAALFMRPPLPDAAPSAEALATPDVAQLAKEAA
jgi:hypothetical protein